MESSRNPFLYFENLIEYEEICKLRDQFIVDSLKNLDGIKNIDKEKGVLTFEDSFYDEYKEDYVDRTSTLRFDSFLEKQLFIEFQKSKSIIDTIALQNIDNYLSILHFQEKPLQYIITRGKLAIALFPIILKPIFGIQRYINEKYLSENNTKIVLQIPEVLSIDLLDNYSDLEIINNVIGYLKGDNDKREKIMPDEQYNLMLSYVNHFIEHNEEPKDMVKLGTLQISKNLLQFTFWVLHKKIYTTSEIKMNYLIFIKNMFSQFDTWELKTLKTKFGGKDKVNIAGVKFIPDIIKDYFN